MRQAILAGAVLATVPALYVRLGAVALSPPAKAAIFGLAVLGAAGLLSWAAELAQFEVSQGLAVALLALIAVLPEYAVDLYFAWAAAERPSYAAYATANMTGANRLLVGIGWPIVVLLFGLRFRRRSVVLEDDRFADIAYLCAATLYAFTIPLKGQLSLWDTAILLALFAGYIRRTMRGKVHEPELVGPAASLARLPTGARRAVTVLLFLFSGAVILLVAEPFANALVESGDSLGIDEFLLVQWVAPLASEAPEFVIASIWAIRGDAAAGLGALVSSKVNQWTLLIGTIPIAYSIGLERPGALPLDPRQEHELWLTAAQSLFAVAVLTNLDLDIPEAVTLLVLFLAQLLFPPIRLEVSGLYLVLALVLLVRHRRDLRLLYSMGIRVPASRR